MKNICLLGATGSIGMSTVDVVVKNPEKFNITSFSFNSNIDRARKLIDILHPDFVCCGSFEAVKVLNEEFPETRFSYGEAGMIEAVKMPQIDVVLTAVSGSIGLKPTIEAIQAGKDIALANKETLVMAGEFVMNAAQNHNVKILPVDSEHSAIFQCLEALHDGKELREITITASGGSFRDLSREDLKHVTVSDALNHPNWQMGPKITVDSSTMVNKGLEVIEAHHLFNIDYDNIKVLLHRESVVHSLITTVDGALLAQLGPSDMREPIQYALTYPERSELIDEKYFDLAEMGSLSFEAVDLMRFPMLALAFKVGRMGGEMPAVFNAANEVAVEAFLKGKIEYLDIEDFVLRAVKSRAQIVQINVTVNNNYNREVTLETILEVDRLTRELVQSWVDALVLFADDINHLHFDQEPEIAPEPEEEIDLEDTISGTFEQSDELNLKELMSDAPAEVTPDAFSLENLSAASAPATPIAEEVLPYDTFSFDLEAYNEINNKNGDNIIKVDF
ncbi:MAG: 1-deoxy-D-xylulose-5-phosphate reductoisomerase [Lactobacillales bacterium]|nr:1-deoxy-D-xylulose-5-phosphate reductoisomerase [Lactobacillales bacterium]